MSKELKELLDIITQSKFYKSRNIVRFTVDEGHNEILCTGYNGKQGSYIQVWLNSNSFVANDTLDRSITDGKYDDYKTFKINLERLLNNI